MPIMTRRQFGAGMAAMATVAHLPGGAIARPNFAFDALSTELQEGVNQLLEDYALFLEVDRDYDDYGPWAWRLRYEALFDAHEYIREEIKDETPTMRKLLDWANSLFPCPGRQAQEYWIPLRNLSDEFKPLQTYLYAVRMRSTRASYAYWTRYPNTVIGKDDTLETFQTMLMEMNEASQEWSDVWRIVSETWSRTPDDRQLTKRVLRSHSTLDVPFLQSIVSDWKPFYEWPQYPRCPLSCPVCDGLRLPVVKDDA